MGDEIDAVGRPGRLTGTAALQTRTRPVDSTGGVSLFPANVAPTASHAGAISNDQKSVLIEIRNVRGAPCVRYPPLVDAQYDLLATLSTLARNVVGLPNSSVA